MAPCHGRPAFADTQDDQQRYMEALELSAVLLVGGPLAGTSSLSPAGVAGTKTIATTGRYSRHTRKGCLVQSVSRSEIR